MWNYCQFPSGVVPIRLIQPGEEAGAFPKRDGNWGVQKQVEKIMKGSQGLPMAVQIVALPQQDEKLLGVMKQV